MQFVFFHFYEQSVSGVNRNNVIAKAKYEDEAILIQILTPDLPPDARFTASKLINSQNIETFYFSTAKGLPFLITTSPPGSARFPFLSKLTVPVTPS